MKPKLSLLARIFVAVFLVVSGLSVTGLFTGWERTLLDARFRLRGPLPVNPAIVHVDIDTDALKAEGTWNVWTGARHATVINILKRLGVASFGMDIFFTERGERSISLQKLKATGRPQFSFADLERLVPDGMNIFCTAMKNAGFVVLSQLFEDEPEYEKYDYYRENRKQSLAVQQGRSIIDLPAAMSRVQARSNITPVLADYAQAAAATGFAQVIPDPDGVVRRYPLFFRLKDKVYASLGLMTTLVARGLSMADYDPASTAQLVVFRKGTNELRIPLREDGSLYINWRGGLRDSHPHISYSAIKWLGYGIVLREMKAILARVGEDALFDRDRFLQLPEVVALTREFGDGTPLAGPLSLRALDRDSASIVEEVWNRLLLAVLVQKMLDEKPALDIVSFLKETGVEDSPGARDFFYGIKYATLLLHQPELLAKEPTTDDLARVGVEDKKRFTDCRALLAHEKPSAAERPYFFYPAPIVESLGGPLYSGYLRGKICFYGLTAAGTHDLNPMPFDARYPMVGVHANIADNILRGDAIFRASPALALLAAVLFALVAGFVFSRVKGAKLALSALVLLAVAAVGNYLAFALGNTWLNIVPTVLVLLGFFVATLITNYLGEEREKKRIRGAFSRYVAPALVDQIMQNPGMLKLGGEKRICTVFFSDIAGFTTLSEGLTPERLVEFLNMYLTEVTDIVLAHGGMLDKYEGDAVMAVFGAPVWTEDHAARACRAAIAVQQRLTDLRVEWRAKSLPEFITRIGLNSGPMVVGNMGSRERFDYTVIGDAVNLGSRLEGANKQYGTFLMISEDTRAMAGADAFVTRELDQIRVKGKAEPVRVYELIDEVRPQG